MQHADRQTSTRVYHFGAKLGDEGVDRCKPNFNTIWERHMGLLYAKEIVSIPSAALA